MLSLKKSISENRLCLTVPAELQPQLLPVLEKSLKDKKYLDALSALAYINVLGLGVPQNFEEAEKYAERALLENSDDSAVIGVAKFYWHFDGEHPHVPYSDPKLFLERMLEIRPTQRIAQTLAEIMSDVSEYMLMRKWYIVSYTLGSGHAAWELGQIYDQGITVHVEPNLQKAITWYERAFKKGVVRAAGDIVRCLEEDAADQHVMLQIEWLKKGAKAGCSNALFGLISKRYSRQMLNEFDRTWWILLHYLSRDFKNYFSVVPIEGINKELLYLVPVVLVRLGRQSSALSSFVKLIDPDVSAFNPQRSFDSELIEKFIQGGEKEGLLEFNGVNIDEALERLKVEQYVVSRGFKGPR